MTLDIEHRPALIEAATALLKTSCFINGKWEAFETHPRLEVFNPSTGKMIGTVPDIGRRETEAAIDAASWAFRGWRKILPGERAVILRRWYELVIENANALAAIITMEQGKPFADARGEVLYGADFLRLYSEEATRITGEVLPRTNRLTRNMVTREPIGVVGAVTPWNFPSVLVARKAAPALAAGCTMVLKPAPETPFSALALAVLAERAGVPAGVFNVVTGDAEPIGDALMARPDVRMFTFTGSTDTGRKLAARAAATVKRVSLELGGNAPFIVFDDANLELAVQHAIASKFRNAGQTCSCTNRFLVQEGIKPAFVDLLSQEMAPLRAGDGFDPETSLGPIISGAGLAKIETHVCDALAKGAALLRGGQRHEGLFYPATLLDGITKDMALSQEETFGPVAGIQSFKTEEEALSLANATEYGLSAYFFTENPDRLFRVAERLEAGVVGANTSAASSAFVPFGGVKQSGLGREGAHFGIEEYLEIKLTAFGQSGAV